MSYGGMFTQKEIDEMKGRLRSLGFVFDKAFDDTQMALVAAVVLDSLRIKRSEEADK